MPSYKDFFYHVQRRAQEEKKERSREERLERLSEKLAEKFDVSPVKALQMVQERLEESPKTVLREWMRKVDEAPNKRNVDSVIERLKDEADAPSVGDEVKVKFEREHLTPRQEELDGSKATVKVRDAFSKGSQRARYTVEVHESETEVPQTINNLTPGEIVPLDSNSEA